MKCPNCGYQLEEGTVSCSQCGMRLTDRGDLLNREIHSNEEKPRTEVQTTSKVLHFYPPQPKYNQTAILDLPIKSNTKKLLIGVVIGFIIIGAFLFILDMFIRPPPSENPYLDIPDATVLKRTISNDTYWDADIQINGIEPSGYQVSWFDLNVIIKSSQGPIILNATIPMQHDRLAYDNGSDGSVDVQVWYLEQTDEDLNVDKGETIRLTGLTRDFIGATIEIEVGRKRIAVGMLPSSFP